MQSLSVLLNDVNTMPASLPIFWWWKNEHGVFCGASEFAAQFLGFEKSTDLIGLRDEDTSAKEYAKEFRQNDKMVIKHRSMVQYIEHTFSSLTHENCLLIVNKYPVMEDDSAKGVFGIATIVDEKLLYATSAQSKKIRQIQKAEYYYFKSVAIEVALTRSQSQCLQYLIIHPSAIYEEVGKALKLKKRTVESYMIAIRKRLSVESKAEMITRAIEFGWDKIHII